MNKKRVIKVGNLFEFAENRLIKRLQKGEIFGYSELDVIVNAIKLREHLDKYGKLIIPTLTREEIKNKNRVSRHRYFLRTGR
jgi:hypothetical protein